MRLVVVALIVMNIGYALWQWQCSPVEESAQRVAQEASPPIMLLAEVEKTQRQQELDKVVSNAVRVDKGENNAVCDAIGPFSDIVDGQTVVERLEVLGTQVRLQALDDTTGEYDFRIMIPPVSSLEDAFRKLRELQAQGIDSYVITKGEDALAISLGVYSSDTAAKVAQESHAKDGYQSRIAKIPRLNRNFWLVHQGSTALTLPKAVFQEILVEFPQISLASVNCAR
jgi:hypothetical protein|tara:strand:+ start:1026 stop:1706 length:681 start_codon:yes stop_codon:yes gene_type:complete